MGVLYGVRNRFNKITAVGKMTITTDGVWIQMKRKENEKR